MFFPSLRWTNGNIWLKNLYSELNAKVENSIYIKTFRNSFISCPENAYITNYDNYNLNEKSSYNLFFWSFCKLLVRFWLKEIFENFFEFLWVALGFQIFFKNYSYDTLACWPRQCLENQKGFFWRNDFWYALNVSKRTAQSLKSLIPENVDRSSLHEHIYRWFSIKIAF